MAGHFSGNQLYATIVIIGGGRTCMLMPLPSVGTAPSALWLLGQGEKMATIPPDTCEKAIPNMGH